MSMRHRKEETVMVMIPFVKAEDEYRRSRLAGDLRIERSE